MAEILDMTALLSIEDRRRDLIAAYEKARARPNWPLIQSTLTREWGHKAKELAAVRSRYAKVGAINKKLRQLVQQTAVSVQGQLF